MVIFGPDLLIHPRCLKAASSIWTHSDCSRRQPYGSEAQSSHGAVGHLDDPGDVGVGCIRQARRSRLGGVVPKEEDGQPLRVLGGES